MSMKCLLWCAGLDFDPLYKVTHSVIPGKILFCDSAPKTATPKRCDLAILDMPCAWRQGAITALRKANPQVKLLALVEFGNHSTMKEWIKAGVDEVLDKPVPPLKLTLSLRLLMRIIQLERELTLRARTKLPAL